MRHTPPTLERAESLGVGFWTDPALRKAGVVVAFSERRGGVSDAPFASLNLAAHVGDDPNRVDVNRDRFMRAVGLEPLRDRIVTVEQVHGDRLAVAGETDAGSGAWAARGTPPIAGTDAILTGVPDLPLLLLFADCVPVVLAAPGPAVAVVHAGWRGALAGIVGTSACLLADRASVPVSALRAYIGPFICHDHYTVSDDVLSLFVNAFGTVSRAGSGGLDLGAVVSKNLTDAGVDPCMIAGLAACTAEATDRYFSYRAEGRSTGRHGALACIFSPSSP